MSTLFFGNFKTTICTQRCRKLHIERVGKKGTVMKTIIFSVTVSLFVLKSFSQATTGSTINKDYYLQKSKNQKTAAWVMIGGGAVLFGAGLAVQPRVDEFDNIFDVFNENKYHGFGARAALITGGILVMGGSIPLFIASSGNKQQAMSLALSNDQIAFPLKSGWTYAMQPAVKMTLPIGSKQIICKRFSCIF